MHITILTSSCTVKLGEHTLQLLPGAHRTSYARAHVEVQERLDGSLVVAYQGQVIATKEAPPHTASLRARKALRVNPKEIEDCQHPTDKEKGTVGEPGVPSSPQMPSISRPSVSRTPDSSSSPNHPWRNYPVVTKSLTR